MKQILRLPTAVALTTLVTLGCGMLTGPDGSEPLAIQRFLVTPERVKSTGGKVTLLWSVEGADMVSIDHGIGEVEARGSVQVTPNATTTYTLTAAGENSSATATVRVVVGSSPSDPAPSPSPSPNPTPSPSPSASPSPSPVPSAVPSAVPSLPPSPAPTPSPSPSAGAACGAPASLAGCLVTVVQPKSLGLGECIQVTRLTAAPICPVSAGVTRTIGFDITAHSAQALSWRRAAGGQDAVTPASGPLVSNGVTTVNASAVVYDSSLTFEVVDASGQVVLKFTMQHR